ncbi:hypothetical protein F7725_019418 [Dissostichus mawsoni]|uniref:Uncharacterized protein n=1 Tax=Dissostichus mawsoni TaxID=36200 RepID=A0A7J5YLS1_DISMA|nr:hypothetical protein F7725_019418 [Dissostichus mawsoni]
MLQMNTPLSESRDNTIRGIAASATGPSAFRMTSAHDVTMSVKDILCGLAPTAAGLAAGPLPTPPEDYGSTPRAGGRAAEIHTPPAGFRGGRIASTPSENYGSAPRASGLAAEILAPPGTTGHHRTPPDWLQKRPAS